MTKPETSAKPKKLLPSELKIKERRHYLHDKDHAIIEKHGGATRILRYFAQNPFKIPS